MRIGRKPLLLAAQAGVIVLAWPLFWLMHYSSTPMIMRGQSGFAVWPRSLGALVRPPWSRRFRSRTLPGAVERMSAYANVLRSSPCRGGFPDGRNRRIFFIATQNVGSRRRPADRFDR